LFGRLYNVPCGRTDKASDCVVGREDDEARRVRIFSEASSFDDNLVRSPGFGVLMGFEGDKLEFCDACVDVEEICDVK